MRGETWHMSHEPTNQLILDHVRENRKQNSKVQPLKPN